MSLFDGAKVVHLLEQRPWLVRARNASDDVWKSVEGKSGLQIAVCHHPKIHAKTKSSPKEIVMATISLVTGNPVLRVANRDGYKFARIGSWTHGDSIRR